MTQEISVDNSPMQQADLPPKATALVIDDQIVDILYTDENMSAILLSNPVILDVTEAMNDPILSKRPSRGWAYNPEENSLIGNNDGNDPIVISL